MAPPADIYGTGVYAAQHPTWHEEDSPWKAAQILEFLHTCGIEPARVAEIGCGAGGVLAGVAEGLRSVTHAVGWELAPYPLERARRHASERVSFVQGDLLRAAAHYDLCLCIDVLEHVPDYLGFLQKLRDRADLFVFHIPLDMHCSAILRDRHTSVRKSVGHLHYFSRATALATLEDCGYEIKAERYTDGAAAQLSGHRGWQTATANTFRRILPDGVAAKILGGYSLLVLAD